MRACVLPTPGDPYLARMWLESYKKWKDEIDTLYVQINANLPQEVLDYTAGLYREAGAQVTILPKLITHGDSLNMMVPRVKEEYLLFMEDDFYILDSDVVHKSFVHIEEGKYDAIGSPRDAMSMRIKERMATEFNLSGYLARNPTFWPCFFFIRTADIMRTDLWFDSKYYKRGSWMQELEWTVPAAGAPENGDTFAWISIQLRAMGLKFTYQFAARASEVLKTTAKNMRWLHMGATLHMFNHLRDENGEPFIEYDHDVIILGRADEDKAYDKPRHRGVLEYYVDPGTRLDYGRRAAYALLIVDQWPIPDNHPAASFNNRYRSAVERFIAFQNYDKTEIVMWQEEMAKLIKSILRDKSVIQQPLMVDMDVFMKGR